MSTTVFETATVTATEVTDGLLVRYTAAKGRNRVIPEELARYIHRHDLTLFSSWNKPYSYEELYTPATT